VTKTSKEARVQAELFGPNRAGAFLCNHTWWLLRVHCFAVSRAATFRPPSTSSIHESYQPTYACVHSSVTYPDIPGRSTINWQCPYRDRLASTILSTKAHTLAP